MKITQEKAKEDLEKVLERFGTVGPGSEMDRAAQMILQMLSVAKNRLDPELARMIYVDNEEAKKMLPEMVLELMTQYADGKINETEVKKTLSQLEEEYKRAFNQMGYKPQTSYALAIR